MIEWGSMKSYYNYWGKAEQRGDGNYSCHLLVYHSLDVAAVASLLIEKEENVLSKLSEITGVEKKILLQFLLFLISIHDIGKYSVTFQNLVPELLKKMQNRDSLKQYQYEKARHDQLGMYFFEYILYKNLDEIIKSIETDIASPRKVLNIIRVFINTTIGHHGIPARSVGVGDIYLNDFFEQCDQTAASDFFEDMLQFFCLRENLRNIVSALGYNKNVSKKILSELKPVSWKLAGLITICDWTASGSDFSFHSEPESIENYWKRVIPIAEKAIERTGILSTSPSKKAGFVHLFPEYTDSATPLQKISDQIEIDAGPQLYILEDLTGSGKTEAAMTLTSRMMASGMGDGCYIGLPTMATANAMFKRMGECYRKLFSNNVKPSIVLSHGSRHLSEAFRSSVMDNVANDNDRLYKNNKNMEINSGKFHCTTWLADSTKKSLLADIGVGTIDQLLLSILPVRYQNLRYYGMTKKILVVDEVHSYDPYMNKLLSAVLKAHISAGGSAVLLSATIPNVLKGQLINSFFQGIGKECTYNPKNNKFPLLTKVAKNDVKELAIERDGKTQNVTVEFLYDDDAICAEIKNKRNKNYCISWIRNTVSDVFDAYEKLTSEYGIPAENIIVFHSRFAYTDRINIEEQVLKLFGKESTQSAREGKVVIATQVIEQSLDLDFDVMVSDLAPIELIIQRAGRLHRHNRGERGKPFIYIYSPPETEIPDAEWYKRIFPKAAYVYKNTTILWRTKEVLKMEGAIILPERARVLVESVYGENPINAPECFIKDENEAEGEKIAQEDTADFSKLFIEEGYCRESALNEWDEEEKVSTRLSEEQNIIYLCRFNGEKIEPLYSGDFPWEMSSLKIHKGKIGEIKYQREIEKAISTLKEKKKFREDDIFLLSEDATNVESIVDVELEDIKITYSTKFGLRVDKK